MNHQQWIRHITGGGLDGTLLRLYPAEQLSAQRRRYCGVIDQFTALYPSPADRDIWLFSAPGRVELGGNHTDHNHGRVLAAAIDLDIIAAAAVNDAQTNGHPVIRVTSDSYPQNVVTLDSLDPRPAERGRSAGMIRGVAAGFTAAGCPPADFDTYTTATVLKGSGLSSSAAFEVLIGTMLNQLFAGGAVPPLTVARIAQRAENEYFGKPSGLMDQAASAIGAAVMLDFADPKTPAAAPLSIDFAAHGFALCVVDTGGSHADLTAEYAAIPAEMRGVAAALGHTVLRECDPAAFYTALPQLRRSCGDRAVLRAAHFFAEN
ncbi:MAG: galactokinase, partial [Oscillospiraceae bacterium]|nr:galactokinase [Oscillospiraceae bacterium]